MASRLSPRTESGAKKVSLNVLPINLGSCHTWLASASFSVQLLWEMATEKDLWLTSSDAVEEPLLQTSRAEGHGAGHTKCIALRRSLPSVVCRRRQLCGRDLQCPACGPYPKSKVCQGIKPQEEPYLLRFLNQSFPAEQL